MRRSLSGGSHHTLEVSAACGTEWTWPAEACCPSGPLGLDCPLMEAATMSRLVRRQTGYRAFNESGVRESTCMNGTVWLAVSRRRPGRSSPTRRTTVGPSSSAARERPRSQRQTGARAQRSIWTRRAGAARRAAEGGGASGYSLGSRALRVARRPRLERWLVSAVDGGRGAPDVR